MNLEYLWPLIKAAASLIFWGVIAPVLGILISPITVPAVIVYAFMHPFKGLCLPGARTFETVETIQMGIVNDLRDEKISPQRALARIVRIENYARKRMADGYEYWNDHRGGRLGLWAEFDINTEFRKRGLPTPNWGNLLHTPTRR